MSAANPARELTETQHRAIRALLGGETDAVVARGCGISDRTLRDWRTRPEFRAALQAGQQQLFQAICGQVAAAATEAIRTLAEISQSPSERSSVRVAAAGRLLSFLLRSGSLATPPVERCANASALTADQLLALLATLPVPAPGPEPAAAPQVPPPSSRSAGAEAAASPSPTLAPPANLHRTLGLPPARTGRPAASSRLPSRPFREIPTDDSACQAVDRSLTQKVPVATR